MVLETRRGTAYLGPISGKRIMSMTNPVQFLQQVRSEVGKITWPTRREVLLTTAMVFVMATVAAIFFSLVDWVIRTGVGMLIG